MEAIMKKKVLKVYGLDCVIRCDPITNAPMIVPCGKYHRERVG